MKKLLFIITILAAQSIYAQQYPNLSQFVFNSMVYNPAYTGSSAVLNASLLYRKQWMGFGGAPQTQALTVDGLSPNAKAGYGILILNDMLGAQRQTMCMLNYSYHIKLFSSVRMNLGIAAGINNSSIDGRKLTTNYYDPAVPVTKVNQTAPDAKAGLLLYTDHIYLSFAATEILSNAVFPKNKLMVAQTVPVYFLGIGGIVDLTKQIALRPSILLKDDFKGPSNVDLQVMFVLDSRVWIGVTDRTSARIFTKKKLDNSLVSTDALSLIFQYKINDNIKAGYAHDFSTSMFAKHQTSEIMLSYSFAKKTIKNMLTPRFL